MADVKNILFALELTEISERLAPWVQLAVKKFNASLHVLHVVPSLEMWGVPFVSRALESQDNRSLAAKIEPDVVEFCRTHLGWEHGAEIAVVAGRPAEAIVDYVSTQGMDLVIVGTHARRGLDKAVFGSVADRVLRLCPVPVLYINPLRGVASL